MSEQFKYPQCSKGQFHVGESLNLVCIEPKCIEKSVICGICYNEEHRDHKIKPIKVLVHNAKKYLNQMTPVNIDSKAIQATIKQNQKSLLAKYEEFENYVSKIIGDVRNSLEAVFIKINEQVQLKTGGNEEMLKALDEISQQEIETERFMGLMKKILAGVPIQEAEDDMEISGNEVQKAIEAITKKMDKDLTSKSEGVKKQLDSFMASLQKTVEMPSIFDANLEFKFSNQLKHPGIQVVSQNVVKSIEGYNYHFALMESSIQEKGNRSRSVAFKIKQNTSNWVAVGLCHKNVVQLNSYTFSYSTLGHGGYMISSNGGSWSSIDSSKNNVVNSFPFAKNDIILVSYEPDENKIVFSKKNTDKTHTLEFESKDDDELYLCALFYYQNDEIEYLGPSESITE